MGVFNLFKKKQVPDTLPDLAVGSPASSPVSTQPTVSPQLSAAIPAPPTSSSEKPVETSPVQSSDAPSETAQATETSRTESAPEQTSSSETPVEPAPSEEQPTTTTETPAESVPEKSEQLSNLTQEVVKLSPTEQSFFKDLLKDVTKEMKSLDKFDQWYRAKFDSEDVVLKMREYWKNQTPEVFLRTTGADLKAQIVQRANALHNLEKEWQELYFSLLAKEDAIRKEEKELKKLVSTFVSLGKKYFQETNEENVQKNGKSSEHKETKASHNGHGKKK